MIFFAQLPLGFVALLSLKPRGLFISFARTKETKQRRVVEDLFEKKSPSALFVLLRQVFPLNKKNSLRSNSFLFFTLQHSPPLHAQKVRPDLSGFFAQHRFARWGVIFSFFASLFFVIQSGAKRSEGSRVHPHHERSDVPSREGYFRPQWRSVKKNQVFSVKNEKLFERSEFFSFRKICGFFSSGA